MRLPVPIKQIAVYFRINNRYANTHTQKKRGKEKNRWQFLPTNNLHGKENLLSDHRPLFHANNFIIYSSLSFDSQHVFSTSNQSRTTCCTRGKKEKKKITSTFVRKNFVRPPTGYKTTLWSKKKKMDVNYHTTYTFVLFYSILWNDTPSSSLFQQFYFLKE